MYPRGSWNSFSYKCQTVKSNKLSKQREVSSCNSKFESCSSCRYSCIQGPKHCSEGSVSLFPPSNTPFSWVRQMVTSSPSTLHTQQKGKSSSVAMAEKSLERP